MPTTTRRAFLRVSLAVLLGPRAALAQPVKVARLGLLASSGAETFAASLKIFRKSLQELGWVEGQNLTIEARYAGAHYDQLPALAAELVKLEVDVILTLATPAIQAAKRARRPFRSCSRRSGTRSARGSCRTWPGPGAT